MFISGGNPNRAVGESVFGSFDASLRDRFAFGALDLSLKGQVQTAGANQGPITSGVYTFDQWNAIAGSVAPELAGTFPAPGPLLTAAGLASDATLTIDQWWSMVTSVMGVTGGGTATTKPVPTPTPTPTPAPTPTPIPTPTPTPFACAFYQTQAANGTCGINWTIVGGGAAALALIFFMMSRGKKRG